MSSAAESASGATRTALPIGALSSRRSSSGSGRPSVAVAAMALRTPPGGGSTSSIGWSGTSFLLRDEGPRYVDDPPLGSFPGSRIAMRVVRSAGEDEVIAAFLRAEIYSDRFGKGILAAL